jgi:hypothetical protein
MSITVVVRPSEGADALETETAIPANTFAGNQEAQRAVGHARRDAADAKVDDGASSSLVGQRTIRIQLLRGENELVKDWCARLVTSCNQQLVQAEQKVLKQTSACQSEANSFVSRKKCNWSAATGGMRTRARRPTRTPPSATRRSRRRRPTSETSMTAD